MNKVILIVIIAAVVVLVYLNTSSYLEIQEKERVIDRQAEDIEVKRTEIVNLTDTVEAQEEDIEQKTGKIISLENNVSTLKSKVNTLNLKVNNIENTLNKTKTELSGAIEEIEELTPVVKNFFAAGVSEDGLGVIIPMDVKISRGSGILSVNINKVDLQSGVQSSIRLAADVASVFSGVSIKDRDITVSFVNEGQDIVSLDGDSAGGAVTVTIIAALQDKDIRPNVMMTGTIKSDFSIGPIGGVRDKATAAKEAGANKFLVPLGQGVSVSGIDVVEVRNIEEVVSEVLV